MRPENRHRLPTLNQQSFVRFKLNKRFHNFVKALPVASRFTRASVDDKVLWIFGHFRVQNVAKHTQDAFYLPIPTMQFRPS